MSVRANFQKSYLMRYTVLASVCLLMAAWFGYDGFIGYPQQLEYAQAYEPLRDLDAAERIAQWKQLAKKKNWPTRPPTKTAAEIREDITGQYFWSALNLLLGVPALVLLLRSRGSWVESTDGGLKTSWGQSLQFSDVTSLDKRKWARKGIAKARYGVNGSERVFIFDDFKFEREPLGKMLRDLESVLRPEQITGGPPEAELEAQGEAEETPSQTQSAETR